MPSIAIQWCDSECREHQCASISTGRSRISVSALTRSASKGCDSLQRIQGSETEFVLV